MEVENSESDDRHCENFIPLTTAVERNLVSVGVTAAVALFCVLAAHRLNLSREKRGRRAGAATTFRAAIRSAALMVPPASEHWEVTVVSALPSVCANIASAVDIFAPFAVDRASRLHRELDLLTRHCTVELPKALSPAEKFYGGGSSAARAAKEKFYSHLEGLIACAGET